MRRREFLAAAAVGSAALVAKPRLTGQEHAAHQAGGRIYASPAEAMASPREELAYVVATYAGTKVQQPDFLATIDLDPGAGRIRRSSIGCRCPTSATNCTTSAGTPAPVATARSSDGT